METKINSGKCKKVRLKCGFTQELYVDPIGLSGGLAVWWQDSITLSVLYRSKNIIHAIIDSDCLNAPRMISFIYGPPKEGERRIVWDSLRRLASGITDSWLVVGDFNDLLSQSEKEGGNPRAMRKIINFQGFLSDCNLMDLEFKGSQFTWCNKRDGAIVRERLDRALGNVEFRDTFHHAVVFHVDPVGSDHHALVVDCCHHEEKAPKVFRFEANWVHHVDFLSVVRRSWLEGAGVMDDKIQDLIRWLAFCRKGLMVWDREEFPHFQKLVVHLRQWLADCYKGPMVAGNLLEAEELVKQIEETLDREETYWWQRLRISWLKCGDKNTGFFHSSVIQ
ncbi:hypothetical protein QN277_014312 [Acacia crassicarpa]|uniref:Endonuclease/exonuclease/phosphatase domain-containing protein n=1 Tax=Acacia crassicarpa TaxID=499986 RepID=A0AAE1IMB0_9FABA|nr:hypothetical protein QN277_014312 [Acacia crassicarpa]